MRGYFRFKNLQRAYFGKGWGLFWQEAILEGKSLTIQMVGSKEVRGQRPKCKFFEPIFTCSSGYKYFVNKIILRGDNEP